MIIVFAVCLSLALGFGVAWRRLDRIAPAVAAVSWLLYPAYELWFQSRCIGECNIRVDLILIALWLLAVSVLALVAIGRRLWRPVRPSSDRDRA